MLSRVQALVVQTLDSAIQRLSNRAQVTTYSFACFMKAYCGVL